LRIQAANNKKNNALNVRGVVKKHTKESVVPAMVKAKKNQVATNATVVVTTRLSEVKGMHAGYVKGQEKVIPTAVFAEAVRAIMMKREAVRLAKVKDLPLNHNFYH